MNRLVTSFVVAAGLVFANVALTGCEKKEDSAKDMQQAADKTGAQAADALGKAKSETKEGVNQAKDASAGNMDAVQKNIDDLIAKAEAAVKDKKWSDAEGYITQIKSAETSLPQAAQDKINATLADVQKMIDAGKAMAPGK